MIQPSKVRNQLDIEINLANSILQIVPINNYKLYRKVQ